MSKEYRHIGKVAPRIAAREIVTGKAKYIGDIKRPHMLYGKVLRSPYSHANIKHIDTSKAEKLRGVKAVLTYKNAPDWIVAMSSVPHMRVLDSKVRYAGDAVAIVAAKTEQIAEEALELIDVKYEQLPAVYEVEEAMKPDAPLLYPDLDFKSNIFPKNPRQGSEYIMGDVEKGFGEADVIVEGKFKVENFQNPLPPEPPGMIAEWKADQVTIRGSFQSLGMTELILRYTMKMPPGGIRLIAPYVGGSYGSKHTLLPNILFAAALSKMTHRPVCLIYTKEEHFASYSIRMGCRAHYKIGIKKDGTVTAIAGEWLANSGPNITYQDMMMAVGLEALPILAKVSNVNVTTKLVVTNTIPSGAYRGFGYLENTNLLSSVLFMAMEKVSLDPVEYFKKNCIKLGDEYLNPYMNIGKDISAAPDIVEAIEKGAELFAWEDKWKGWGKPTAVNGTKRKAVGMGIGGHSDVGEQESHENVQLNVDGSVRVYCCATEFGTGTRDVVLKIAAEALNVPLANVRVTPADTLVAPWDWGSTGSRSTYAMGTAVLAAAEDAKQKLFKRAAPMLRAKPEDLETKDGMVYVKGAPEKMIPWIAVIGWQGLITGEGHFPGRYNLPTYQIHFVELEVDLETGEVSILNYVSSTDCGQIINPLALQGQLQGYFPGVDLALMEETVVDKATGRMLNPNMIDYKTRTFPELPNHQFVIVETPPEKADPKCPFGARGVGEQTLTPAAPAVCMAIYNAIGKRFSEYPITPDKILTALGKV